MKRPPPRYVLVLAVSLAAFAAAVIWSALTPTTYRAETAIVVGVGNGPLRPGAPGSTTRLARSLDELVHSNLIAANVVTNLRLTETPGSLLERVSVSTPQPGLLRVRVEDDDRVRAEQIAQEIGLVFTNLVRVRFGGAEPPLRATVWDPAHAAGSSGGAWARNLGIAAAVSALAGAMLLTSRRRRRPPPRAARVPVADPEPSRAPLPEPTPKPTRESVAAAVAEPPEPAPMAEPAAPPPLPTDGWTLARLERLVDRHGIDFPTERVDEWRYYLVYLRDYAEMDGRLPEAFDGLVLETFDDLIALERRARAAAPG